MAALVESKQLLLPRDILVLQPMHGHLDLNPMLLTSGTRCTIGTAEHCTARLAHATLVEDEHCVIEVIGRKTMLTSWAHEATWLNDRLVTEPRELISGDRVAIGPFDFRLRFASTNELLEANLVQTDLKPIFEDSVPLITSSGVSLGNELQTDLITELSRRNPRGVTHSPPEKMTQHIASLLGDLQNQVQLLQGKDVELNDQLRQRRGGADEPSTVSRSSIGRAGDVRRFSSSINRAAIQPQEVAWKKLADQAAAKLQADREALDRDRETLASGQAQCEVLLKQIEQQQQELALATQAVAAERQQQQSEEDQLRQQTQQLSEKERQLGAWESRLRETESALDRQQAASVWQTVAPVEPAGLQSPIPVGVRSVEPALNPQTHRPLQTFLTLIAFTSAAILLGIGIGDADISVTVGWSTAIMGAISTVDLLCRRWFGVS